MTEKISPTGKLIQLGVCDSITLYATNQKLFWQPAMRLGWKIFKGPFGQIIYDSKNYLVHAQLGEGSRPKKYNLVQLTQSFYMGLGLIPTNITKLLHNHQSGYA